MGGRGSGGGGRSGNSSGKNNGPYGTVKTVENNSANLKSNGVSFVSESDSSQRIIVKEVKTGSEKQISYSMNLKSEALQTVDRTAASLIKRGAIKDKVVSFRNSLMGKIDAETDSRTVIDSLKDRSRDVQALMKHYNVKP